MARQRVFSFESINEMSLARKDQGDPQYQGKGVLETTFPLTSASVSDSVRMRFGCGSDAVRTWFGCGLDVVRTWFGRVFGSGADSLAEVKGKWFPAKALIFLSLLFWKIKARKTTQKSKDFVSMLNP